MPITRTTNAEAAEAVALLLSRPVQAAQAHDIERVTNFIQSTPVRDMVILHPLLPSDPTPLLEWANWLFDGRSVANLRCIAAAQCFDPQQAADILALNSCFPMHRLTALLQQAVTCDDPSWSTTRENMRTTTVALRQGECD